MNTGAPLGLGLSGAHRTGKTTVARRLAEVNECPLVMSSASQVAKDMGIAPDQGMTMETRLAYQGEVLRRYAAALEQDAGHGLFISDRTPLDFAAYMLTDYHAAQSTPEQDQAVWSYVRQCMTLTGRYFFLVGVIQPGIPYEVRDDKPAPDPLYQERLNTTVIGLASDERVRSHLCVVPRSHLKTTERSTALAEVYGKKLGYYRDWLSDCLPRTQ